jgi:hypothetical protein
MLILRTLLMVTLSSLGISFTPGAAPGEANLAFHRPPPSRSIPPSIASRIACVAGGLLGSIGFGQP